MSFQSFVDKTDNYGRTPLHHAVLKLSRKAVKMLIQNNASVNAVDKNNLTPLAYALSTFVHNEKSVKKSSKDTIERLDSICTQLLTNGADFDKAISELHPSEYTKGLNHYFTKNAPMLITCVINPDGESYTNEVFRDVRVQKAVQLIWEDTAQMGMFKQLWVYCVYLFLLTFISVSYTGGNSDIASQYMGAITTRVFDNEFDHIHSFGDIGTEEEFYMWAHNVLLPQLYPKASGEEFFYFDSVTNQLESTQTNSTVILNSHIIR